MMNLRQIGTLLDTNAHGRLVDRLLDNGRVVSPASRRRLLSPLLVGPAAVALALQRVCELSYAPNPLGTRLAARAESHLEAAWPWPRDTRRAATLLPAAALNLRALTAWQDMEDGVEPIERRQRCPHGAAARSKRQRLGASLVAAMQRPDLAQLDPIAVEIAAWQLDSMPVRAAHDARTVAA